MLKNAIGKTNPRMLPTAPAKDPIVVHKAHSLSPNQITAILGGPLTINAFPAAIIHIPIVMKLKLPFEETKYQIHAPIIKAKPDISVGKTIPNLSIK